MQPTVPTKVSSSNPWLFPVMFRDVRATIMLLGLPPKAHQTAVDTTHDPRRLLPAACFRAPPYQTSDQKSAQLNSVRNNSRNGSKLRILASTASSTRVKACDIQIGEADALCFGA